MNETVFANQKNFEIMIQEIDGSQSITITRHKGTQTEVVIPNTIDGVPVTAIGGRAFFLKGFTHIALPESITAIAKNAFIRCARFTVAEGNPVYHAIDGVLFDKAGTTLVRCPTDRQDSYTIPNGVTHIRGGAFEGCHELSGIDLPEGLLTIGNSAFNGCNSLKNINFPESLTAIGDEAFAECQNIAVITLPVGLVSIGRCAFSGFRILTGFMADENNPAYRAIDSVLFSKDGTLLIRYPPGKNDASYAVPNGVTHIGEESFSRCYNLTSIGLPEGLLAIESRAFYGCNFTEIILPEGLKSIGCSAFMRCDNLTDVTLPKDPSSIGYQPFFGCPLAVVTLPENLSAIEGDVFDGIKPAGTTSAESSPAYRDKGKSLFDKTRTTLIRFRSDEEDASCILPDGLTRFISGAFDNGEKLTDLTLPASFIGTIDERTFSACPKLRRITVDESNPAYRSIDGVLFNKTGTTLLWYPKGKQAKNYTVPDDVTQIGIDGTSGFYECTGLASIRLPDSITVIRKDTFCGCTALTSVTLPKHLASIEKHAFSRCTALTGLMFPKSLVSIGKSAFAMCDALTEFSFPEGLVFLGHSALSYCKSLTHIFYPASLTAIGNLNPKYPDDSDSYDYIDRYIQNYLEDQGANADFPLQLGCDALTHITVAEGNSSYRDIDGVLFDKTGTVLIQYPLGRADETYAIHEGVKRIKIGAFFGCKGLAGINIPDSLAIIEDWAFIECDSLRGVRLPEGLVSIGDLAFEGSSQLESSQAFQKDRD